MRSTPCATSCRSRRPARSCCARVGEVREPYRELLRAVRHAHAGDARLDRETCCRGTRRCSPPHGRLCRCRRSGGGPRVCVIARSRRPGMGLIAGGRLTDLLRRVSVFGVTLAPLDIRQDAARHTDALVGDHVGAGARVLRRMGRADAARVPRPRAGQPAAAHSRRTSRRPEVRDVLDTFRMIASMPPGRSAPT